MTESREITQRTFDSGDVPHKDALVNMRSRGCSFREIGRRTGTPTSTIWDRWNKINDTELGRALGEKYPLQPHDSPHIDQEPFDYNSRAVPEFLGFHTVMVEYVDQDQLIDTTDPVIRYSISEGRRVRTTTMPTADDYIPDFC